MTASLVSCSGGGGGGGGGGNAMRESIFFNKSVFLTDYYSQTLTVRLVVVHASPCAFGPRWINRELVCVELCSVFSSGGGGDDLRICHGPVSAWRCSWENTERYCVVGARCWQQQQQQQPLDFSERARSQKRCFWVTKSKSYCARACCWVR